MTAGNQGKAYDSAKSALEADPDNKDRQREFEKARQELNSSHSRAGTGKRW